MFGLLILDSESISRQELKLMIKDSDYNFLPIYESDSAENALFVFQKQKPSIVIMDSSLPDVESISFGQELLKMSPQVSIIVISQLKMYEMVESSINAGFSGYLMKPFSKNKLLSFLNRLTIPDPVRNVPNINSDLPTSTKKSIERALDYIHQKYHEEITLHEVAKFVYLSDSYFSRLFKNVAKVSFIEYLASYRVEQGKKLLKMTSYPIEVIANQTGFANSSYFTTTFKRMVGKTPTEYRGNLINLFNKRTTKSK